jgi:trigger factor
MVLEFYQKNPQALASLKGTVYEEKIIDLIKTKAKPNKKELTKDEAEEILKKHQKEDHDHPKEIKSKSKKDNVKPKKAKSVTTKVKKVSKK